MRAALWTGVGLVVALVAQSALSRLAPAQARLLDPFLILLVYCALTGGEVHAMLAGAAGGWIQDVHFGGTVVGLSGLSKLIVGFAVGSAGARLVVSGATQRLLALFAATLLDGLLVERLAALFGVLVLPLSFAGMLGRAAVNAVVGTGIYALGEAVRRRRSGA